MSSPAPSRWTRLLHQAAAALVAALDRFPISVVAIGFLTLLANMEIADIRLVDESDDLRLSAALSSAAAIAVVASLLGERLRLAALPRGLIGAVAAVVAAFLVWFGWNGFFFAPPFLAAAILASPLAPHILRSSPLRFWTFLLWTSFGVALGFLSVLIFVLGLSAIFEMVRYLFGIGLSGKAYQHIYATALVLVGPLFALGRIPRDFDEEAAFDRTDRFVGGIATLQNWVALPLALAAAAILHLYVAKIAATGEVPKNQIGWIVGFYALFVLSLRVVRAPIVGAGDAMQRLFASVWVPILVVPVALLVYAVWLRVAAEGFTLERYYLALAALSAVLILLAQALPAIRGDTRTMAAVPIVLLGLSAFGPWGVRDVVARSQTGLIARDFARGAENRIVSDDLDDRRRQILRSRVAAMSDVAALAYLDPLLPDGARREIATGTGEGRTEDAYRKALGIDYGAPRARERVFVATGRRPFDVADFDLVQSGFEANDSRSASESKIAESTAEIRERRIVLRFRGTVDRIDAMPIVERIQQASEASGPIDVDSTTEGGRHVRLHVGALTELEDAGYPSSLRFDLAARASEWPPGPASLGGEGKR